MEGAFSLADPLVPGLFEACPLERGSDVPDWPEREAVRGERHPLHGTGVTYTHDESAAGPHDANYLFDRFRDMVIASKTTDSQEAGE